AQKAGVNTLVFNNELSPSQSRNISDLTHCNVVDRTELILAIFARHARTNQAKLQVELAQLEYNYTRLKHMWRHLSRIEGGIGFRGPGEKQLEVDRREIRKKIGVLKKKLEQIENTTIIKRQRRRRITSIALVGYTNAGKSTIFNKLTHESRFTADQLFATLDAMTRMLKSESGDQVVLTDTIGFIRDLPHRLVASFHSTLMEVIEADLILHVVDISNPFLFDQMDAVNKVLAELDADNKNTLYVFNKIDLVRKNLYAFLRKKILNKYPDSIFLSARQNTGLDGLLDKIDEFLLRSKKPVVLEVPRALQGLISFIHDNTEVIGVEAVEDQDLQRMEVRVPRHLYGDIIRQIEEYKFKEYINKKDGGNYD
ncbi:MAG: GTPase HflX, partial [Candidatus Cloacimonetes bacterium]|nr:GTPase HflX [Candidatus Cloacimonadota bacterium]